MSKIVLRLGWVWFKKTHHYPILWACLSSVALSCSTFAWCSSCKSTWIIIWTLFNITDGLIRVFVLNGWSCGTCISPEASSEASAYREINGLASFLKASSSTFCLASSSSFFLASFAFLWASSFAFFPRLFFLLMKQPLCLKERKC